MRFTQTASEPRESTNVFPLRFSREGKTEKDKDTGWALWSDNWVGLTLILPVPPSARFRLG